MLSTCHMPSPTSALPLLLLALAAARPAAALTPDARWISLEPGLSARQGGLQPSLALAAGWWLEGEVDLVTRVATGAAPRTPGRATAAEVTPSVGLEWGPDLGPWGPSLALAAGLRLGAQAGARACGRLEAGLLRALGRDLAGGVLLGLAWTEGEGVAPQLALRLRLGF